MKGGEKEWKKREKKKKKRRRGTRIWLNVYFVERSFASTRFDSTLCFFRFTLSLETRRIGDAGN